MADNKQHDTRTARRRQNGAGTGSGSRCYTKTGNLTNHKEADFTLLPLYSPPCSVVQ